jgi:hypothetical protein
VHRRFVWTYFIHLQPPASCWFLISLFFLNCYGVGGGGVQLGPLGTAATNRPNVPSPDDYDGEIGEMIGRGNRSTRRKPAPVPLWPPQTLHTARTRTRAAAVGSQRLTAWATARPLLTLTYSSTMNIETELSSETSVDFYRTTRNYIPKDSTRLTRRCESEIPRRWNINHINNWSQIFHLSHC